MQGLVEMVLEADGVTPAMLEEQRARVRLAEQFLQSEDVDIEKLVAEHDARIDVNLFQTMTMMAQRAIEDGRPDIARAVVMVQNRVAELSTAGQELLREQQAQEDAISEVAAVLDELGEDAGRGAFFDLAVGFKDQDAHLQALVGMARPAFDYEFFQEMTGAIGQAPSAERPELEALRDRLVELTRMIDEQAQFTVQQATGLLQAMINSEDPAELVRANAPMIDETFMAVLTANMEEANRRQDAQMGARLRAVSDAVMSVLQEGMQPEMRFINTLLQAETQEAASEMLAEGAEEFGPALLESLQSLEEILAEQGDTPVYRRIQTLREEAARLFS
jgi:hypothetical protein